MQCAVRSVKHRFAGWWRYLPHPVADAQTRWSWPRAPAEASLVGDQAGHHARVRNLTAVHPDDITWKRTASERFDSIAETWKERGAPPGDRLDAVLGMLDRPDGSLILDAGCGSGNWSVALAQRGFRVRGFDLSSE